MRFLRKFFYFLEATRIAENNVHLVVEQALEGPAHDWWIYARYGISTTHELKYMSLAKYWINVVQHRVREEPEFGYYRAEHNLSKSEYATRLHENIIMLDDPPNEAQIVENFSRHFDERVQQATFSRSIQPMDGFLQLLGNMEKVVLLNST